MAFDKTPELFDEEGDSMAFGIGLGHGFRKLDPRPSKHKSTENNPYYYYPGFIIGYFLKIVALFLMGQQIL